MTDWITCPGMFWAKENEWMNNVLGASTLVFCDDGTKASKAFRNVIGDEGMHTSTTNTEGAIRLTAMEG